MQELELKIPGLFLKAVLKWKGMHTLYMCICLVCRASLRRQVVLWSMLVRCQKWSLTLCLAAFLSPRSIFQDHFQMLPSSCHMRQLQTCSKPNPLRQEQGYSLPDWLVDTTSGATGSLTDATEVEDGAAATADFSAHWAKSTRSENYVKDGMGEHGPVQVE